MMYRPGEMIVYGRTGVCRVERIERQENGQDFYVLEALYQNCSIRTPVEGKVFMRPVITRQEAEELTEHYQAFIATHQCRDLVELVKSIYAKRRAAEREKRKFGTVDERFMKEGEALLHGELAVALDMTPEEVPGYISRRLKDRETAVKC